MDKLRGINYFVHTVTAGGFSAAAKELLVTPAAVSKAVALLEQEVGFTLLHRTTRHLKLTAEGADYYEYCRKMLGSLADVESGLAGVHSRYEPPRIRHHEHQNFFRGAGFRAAVRAVSWTRIPMPH